MPCLIAWGLSGYPATGHLDRNTVVVGEAGGCERLMNDLLERPECEQFVHGLAIDDYCTVAGEQSDPGHGLFAFANGVEISLLCQRPLPGAKRPAPYLLLWAR